MGRFRFWETRPLSRYKRRDEGVKNLLVGSVQRVKEVFVVKPGAVLLNFSTTLVFYSIFTILTVKVIKEVKYFHLTTYCNVGVPFFFANLRDFQITQRRYTQVPLLVLPQIPP